MDKWQRLVTTKVRVRIEALGRYDAIVDWAEEYADVDRAFREDGKDPVAVAIDAAIDYARTAISAE